MAGRIPAVVICADEGREYKIRSWADAAICRLNASGRFSVSPLIGHEATRPKVAGVLRRLKGRHGLLVFYGAGGVSGTSLLESQDRQKDVPDAALCGGCADLLKNKIVYTVACHSSRHFGPCAISNGAVCYMGYDHEVYLGFENGVGPGFEQTYNAGLDVLIQHGGTCKDAHLHMRAQFDHWISHWDSQRRLGNPEAPVNQFHLALSREALAVPIGKTEARL